MALKPHRLKPKARLGLLCAAVISAAGFSACGASDAPPIEAGAAVAQASADALSPDSFTTEGKPTKTIETPWGPREVYDPVQDEAVRNAFKNVYDKKYETTNYRKYDYRLKLGDTDLNLLFQAKEIHHTDILRLGCYSLKTFEANISYGYALTLETLQNPCDYEKNIGKAKTRCEYRAFQYLSRGQSSHAHLKGKIRPNQQWYPIGYNIDYEDEFIKTSVEPLVKDLTWMDELSDFFDFECRSWR